MSELVEANTTNAKESKFHWKTMQLPVSITAANGAQGILASVTVEGSYDANVTKMMVVDAEKQMEYVELDKGHFSFPVKLTGDITMIELVAVTLKGKVDKLNVKILFQRWKDALAEYDESKKRAFYSASLGVTTMAFKEDTATRTVTDYSGLALTFKAAYQALLLPPQWDFGINLFFTLLPLNSNIADTTVRYLGVNLRFGYVLPFVKPPWRAAILTGAYFSRMFVTGDRFGYKALLYPQLFPTLRRTINSKDSAFVYLKLVPLGPGLGFSFSERELSLGAGFEHALANRHPVFLSMDFSDLFTIAGSNRSIRSTTFSVSAGYGF
ncbi:MAG: hypothetical protein AABZ06_05585 [Bdellovibrionota bacterium]